MEKESEFLSHIVKGIVDKPEAVEIIQEVDRMGLKLSLKVDATDISKVIGNQGKMANALRTIIHAFGGKHEARIGLVIEEPEGSTRRPPSPQEA